MNDLTYQEVNTNQLETYEWDRTWWDHAGDNQKDRVLIIGDSISWGYRPMVSTMLQGEVYVDGLHTSKACDNKNYLAAVKYVIAQEPRTPRKIFFNWGLHGWHLSTEEYKRCYSEFVQELLRLYPDSELVLVLTTPTKRDRQPKVVERNGAAAEIAEQFGLQTVDLYSEIAEDETLIGEDGIHLEEEGYEKLAKLLCKYIKASAL